ncbi:sugar-binding domain-containing protein [Brachybacterium sp. AOP43-C2-M15]|uniref:sugar-binding domain-containing protein n=1 Tax=Brachybacterium sp. AOP43-C2-M15 TaxID=3457661 RepID=UPI004033CE82
MRTAPFLGHAGKDDAAHGDALSGDQLLAELGRLYYLEDVSKVDLGRRFGLSRFKIARMLAKGRERGIVRIEIHEPTQNLPVVADPLKTTLGLPLVRVVESKGSPVQVRDAVGLMGAQLLRESLEGGDVVGMGGGRTMHALGAQIQEPPAVTLVQLVGALPSTSPTAPLDELRPRVEGAGGSVHTFGAPLFAGSVQRRDSWTSQMSAVRELYDGLDLAVVGIGAWGSARSVLRTAYPPAVCTRIDDEGPVAEMLGHWFTADGAVVAQDVTRMSVTTEIHQLSAAPHVVAVAAGADKAKAILGVARSGLITGLITDRQAAERMLEIAGAAV